MEPACVLRVCVCVCVNHAGFTKKSSNEAQWYPEPSAIMPSVYVVGRSNTPSVTPFAVASALLPETVRVSGSGVEGSKGAGREPEATIVVLDSTCRRVTCSYMAA